jgi:hypothetical protein
MSPFLKEKNKRIASAIGEEKNVIKQACLVNKNVPVVLLAKHG